MANISRRGVTLIELLVSLMLLLVVFAIGGIAARRTMSIQARMAVRDSRASAISDALRTLARHSAGIEPLRDLRRARDTVLDLVHTIGVTAVCRISGDTIVIGSESDTIPWSTVLPRAVTTDDELRLWRDASQNWAQRSVVTVGAASGPCGDSAHVWPGRAVQRLTLADTISGVAPGATVRVLQRERWSLVRGGDGAWALSMATWNTATNAFQVPQPLLAPLAAPNATGGPGFSVMAVDALGIAVADSAMATARSLLAVLRAPRHQIYGRSVDSVRINVGPH
jgi:prepilin-type N-terminal cleavage/methylation domain-containing protein